MHAGRFDHERQLKLLLIILCYVDFSCNYGCYEVAYSCSLSFYVLNSSGFMLVILTMRELKLLLIILCYVVFSRYYG